MADDNPLEAFFVKNAICTGCRRRWTIKPDYSTTKADLPPEPKKPRSEPAADKDTPPSTATACPLCFGLAGTNSTQLFEVDLTPPSMVFSNIEKQQEQPKDASLISQPPQHPQILKLFSSLSEALAALRDVWAFDSYALEVSIPAVFAVRGQAAWWAAQPYLTSSAAAEGDGNGDNLKNNNKPRVAVKDVREALRHQYVGQLTQLLGKGPTQDSAMRLSFGCRLSASFIQAESQWLAPPPPKVGKKQRMLNKKRGVDGSRSARAAPLLLLSSPSMVAKLDGMPREDFFERCPPSAAALSPPPPIDFTAIDADSSSSAVLTENKVVAIVTISPSRLSQYIGGRYIKLQRGIAQSPWFDFQGDRVGGTSVQEEIAKIVLPGLHADGYTFMSSGREDIDVRMLGNGRPFALEIKNMRAVMPNTEIAAALEKASIAANSGVEIRNIGPLGPESMALLKDREQEKRKSYAAVCWIPQRVTSEDVEKINALGKQGDVEVDQWTPLRVLHRRPNLCRRRAVHEMHAEVLPELPQGYFLLRLTTAAGTYVKEFVHGDRGRTRPCIKDILGCSSAECVYLDVTGVDLDL